MITLSNTQFTELQKHLDAAWCILGSIVVSDDEVQVAQPAKRRIPKPKKSTFFCETPTFTYRYANARPEDARRLPLLFQYLLREYAEGQSYLAPDTKPEDFYSLFYGEWADAVVAWTGSKQDLYYFIKRLLERNLICLPQNWYIWQITENHFCDRMGHPFRNLRNQHLPKKSVAAIERLIDLLDPAATTAADLEQLCRRLGVSFGAL
ncbi:MAG: hypothetical protein ACI30A_01945 [Paludibacteraceae bacterium]